MKCCSEEKLHMLLGHFKKATKRIKDTLGNLKENPFSYPYKKIKGKTNVYRIRVGKYRVL